MSPTNLTLALCLGCLLLVLPRRYALLPVLLGGCYMTLGQPLVVAGLNFYLLRILVLFGMARILIRGEIFGIDPDPIDKVLLAWLLTSSFLYVLFDGAYVAVTERLGYFYDAIGTYALVRSSIRTFDDIVFTAKLCAIVIIPLSVLFVVEHTTGQNPFAVLGAPLLSEVRNGRVRCQGPFKHSILAGTFGATSVPLFVGLWVYSHGNRLLATCAIVAALTIVVTSASSGPLSALVLSTAGLACWFCKGYMRPIRWGIAGLFLTLALVMKAPIWFLIDRLSGLIGGEGYYRSALLDAAVRHFDEWWLIGTGQTAHWMATGIQGDAHSADLVNEFVVQAVHGGLLALALFIWLIVTCFRTTGTTVRQGTDSTSRKQFMIWSLGCVLLGHVASFFSVTYFDQITIFWYLLIGMIAALAHHEKNTHAAPSRVRVQIPPARNARFAHLHQTARRDFQRTGMLATTREQRT